MQTQSSFKLDSGNVAMRLGMCAAALAGTAATMGEAQAAVIVNTSTIVIPQTLAGIYINLLTGATGGSGAAVTGWDFNPYLSNSGTQLGFYWGQTPASTSGGVVASGTGPFLSLAPGAVVSSASTFSAAILAGTTGSPYLTAGTHTLGFRFYNETTSAINYGYMTIVNGGTTGFPATIQGWRFENTGAAITVSAVPEASTALMLSAGALALGAVNLRRLRRQRRLAA